MKLFRMQFYYIPNISEFISCLQICVAVQFMYYINQKAIENNSRLANVIGVFTTVAIVEEMICQINKKMLANVALYLSIKICKTNMLQNINALITCSININDSS